MLRPFSRRLSPPLPQEASLSRTLGTSRVPRNTGRFWNPAGSRSGAWSLSRARRCCPKVCAGGWKRSPSPSLPSWPQRISQGSWRRWSTYCATCCATKPAIGEQTTFVYCSPPRNRKPQPSPAIGADIHCTAPQGPDLRRTGSANLYRSCCLGESGAASIDPLGRRSAFTPSPAARARRVAPTWLPRLVGGCVVVTRRPRGVCDLFRWPFFKLDRTFGNHLPCRFGADKNVHSNLNLRISVDTPQSDSMNLTPVHAAKCRAALATEP
jgi:hypothetical protein